MTRSVYHIEVNVGGSNRLFWWRDINRGGVARGLALPAALSKAPFTYSQALLDRHATETEWSNFLKSKEGAALVDAGVASDPRVISYDAVEDDTAIVRKETCQVFVDVSWEVVPEIKRVYFGMQTGAKSSPVGNPLYLTNDTAAYGKSAPRVFYINPNNSVQDEDGKYTSNIANHIIFSRAFEIVDGSETWEVESYNESALAVDEYPETVLKGLRLESIRQATENADGSIALTLAEEFVPHTVWRSRYPLVTEVKIAKNVVTTSSGWAQLYEGTCTEIKAEYVTVTFGKETLL